MSAVEPTVSDLKRDLDELHYQAWNMSEPWMLDVERRYRWLLEQYLRPTLDNSGSEDEPERPP